MRASAALLDARQAAGRRTVFVAMHSFTPVFKGESRAMQVGVLYNRDARLAGIMLELLRAEGDLTVGDNAPYAVSDVTDYTVPVHAERRGLPHVEIEIRQDLIADAAGQAALGGAVRATAAGGQLERPVCDMLSREVPIDPAHAALLFVDVQNYNARPDGGEYAGMTRGRARGALRLFLPRDARDGAAEHAAPAGGVPAAGIEVMYTVIEA